MIYSRIKLLFRVRDGCITAISVPVEISGLATKTKAALVLVIIRVNLVAHNKIMSTCFTAKAHVGRALTHLAVTAKHDCLFFRKRRYIWVDAKNSSVVFFSDFVGLFSRDVVVNTTRFWVIHHALAVFTFVVRHYVR